MLRFLIFRSSLLRDLRLRCGEPLKGKTFSQLCHFNFTTRVIGVRQAPWEIRDQPRFPYRWLLIGRLLRRPGNRIIQHCSSKSVLPLRAEVLNIERRITNEVLEDLTCALRDRVSPTQLIGYLNMPYALLIKRNMYDGKLFVTSDCVFLDTLCRLQQSDFDAFFSFLLLKKVIISRRIDPQLDVYAITLCSWVCPPNQFIKLNSDGSYKDGVGGGGGIFRDHLGVIRGFYSVPFAHCNSVFEAEVRSLSIGLCKAFKLGLRDLIIELDSIDVVQVLQGSRALSSLERKVIWELPTREFNYTCCSVLRESNEAANVLALLARSLFTTPSSMLEEVRYQAWLTLLNQCQWDEEGSTYFRLRYLRESTSSYIPTSLTSQRNLQIWNSSPKALARRKGNESSVLNTKKRYLHSTCLPPVTHSNLKALHELMPRLSGCGLAVLRPITGYVAPERIQNGFESAKGNTYAFGLLVLKLSTGKRPSHGLRPQEEQSLVKWASSWLRYNKSLEKMVDPNIQKPQE